MPNGKTITKRKIDIHSPEGKLLSTTLQKTISYGNQAILPPDPYERREYIKFHDDHMSEKTELVDLNLTRSSLAPSESGTIIRYSRLVPNCCNPIDEDNFIGDLLWEINKRRKQMNMPCFRPTDDLMRQAERHASKMASERKIKLTDKMNVWMGRSLNASKIVNEWPDNNFKMMNLRIIGISIANVDHNLHKPLYLVVSLYE